MSRASAFLTRSLRQESRLIFHHLTRGALAFFILLAIFLQLSVASRFGSAGSRLFEMIMQLSYWFLSVAGNLYFSVALIEEKEEGTLPLLRMTGVSDFSLLAGKSLPRLVVVILLLLVVMPFTMLSITLGGVWIGQILATHTGFLCYAFLLCQTGLLSGTLCRTGRGAFTLSSVLWFAFELGFSLLLLAAESCQEFGFLNSAFRLQETAAWLKERSTIMSVSRWLTMDEGDSIWHPQASFSLLVGTGCFLLTWLLCEPFSRSEFSGTAGSDTRTLMQRILGRKQSRRSLRAWDNAIFWKSWQYLSGGRRWWLIRAVGIPSATFGVVAGICVLTGTRLDRDVFAGSLMFAGAALFLTDLGRQLGRVLNEEVFQQTLASLCMIPRSVRQLLTPAILGVLPSMLPALCCFSGGLLWLAWEDRKDPTEILFEPWAWHVVAWLLVTLHLGVLLSTYLRHGGMLIAAALIWIGGPVLFAMLAAAADAAGIPMYSGVLPDRVVPCGLILTELAACWYLQRLTIRRVETLTAR